MRSPIIRSGGAALLAAEKSAGARLGILWGQALAQVPGSRERLAEAIAALPDVPDVRLYLVAMEAVRSLKLAAALPQVRRYLAHSNLFVLRAAALTAESLLDRASIPSLIRLIDHPIGIVRRPALRAVQRLTGLLHHTHRRDFEAWCQAHCDPSWPRPQATEKKP